MTREEYFESSILDLNKYMESIYILTLLDILEHEKYYATPEDPISQHDVEITDVLAFIF